MFGGIYKFRSGADSLVGLKRFESWTPPSGFVFQGHWQRADGAGGMFLAEADTAAAVLEATAAWTDLIEFDIVPVLDITESVRLTAKVLTWVGSVS